MFCTQLFAVCKQRQPLMLLSFAPEWRGFVSTAGASGVSAFGGWAARLAPTGFSATRYLPSQAGARWVRQS